MYKQSIAIFLILLFMAFMTTPTFIVAVDDSIDISFLYDCSEEEKESEKNTSIELIVSNSNNGSSYQINSSDELAIGYYFKPYPKPNINLISPPPDFLS